MTDDTALLARLAEREGWRWSDAICAWFGQDGCVFAYDSAAKQELTNHGALALIEKYRLAIAWDDGAEDPETYGWHAAPSDGELRTYGHAPDLKMAICLAVVEMEDEQ